MLSSRWPESLNICLAGENEPSCGAGYPVGWQALQGISSNPHWMTSWNAETESDWQATDLEWPWVSGYKVRTWRSEADPLTSHNLSLPSCKRDYFGLWDNTMRYLQWHLVSSKYLIINYRPHQSFSKWVLLVVRITDSNRHSHGCWTSSIGSTRKPNPTPSSSVHTVQAEPTSRTFLAKTKCYDKFSTSFSAFDSAISQRLKKKKKKKGSSLRKRQDAL